MNKNVVTASPNALVRNVISIMDKKDYKEIPIVDKQKKVLGIVSYFDILNIVRFRGDSKIDNFMMKGTTIHGETKENKALEIMINSGLTGLPVVNSDKKIIGFLSDYDLLNFYKNNKDISKLHVSDLNIKSTTSILENDNIGEARKLMLFNKRDRIPVVNNKGKFIGTILLIDLLRTFYAGKPNKIGRKFIKSEMSKIMSISVEGLVRPDVNIKITSKLKKAIQTILNNNLLGIIVVNNKNEPLGVLERRTILKKIVELLGYGRLALNISGEALEPMILEQIKSMVETNFKVRPSYIKAIKEIRLHIKAVHKEKGRGKVEISMNIVKDKGNLQIRKVGYDIMFTLVDCLDTAKHLLR